MPYEKFLNILFYGLVLEMLQNSKNVGNFYGDEKFFVIKNVFEFYFDCPRKPHFPLSTKFK